MTSKTRELTKDDVAVKRTTALDRAGSIAVEITVRCSATGCTHAPTVAETVRKDAVDEQINALVRSLNRKGWRVDTTTGKPLCPRHSGATPQTKNRRVKPKR